MRKKTFLLLCLFLLSWFFYYQPLQAQNLLTEEQEEEVLIGDETTEATDTAEASLSALVDPAAKQTLQEKKDKDITEVTGTKSDLLASYLLGQPLDNPSWYHFFQVAIRKAVNRGLPSTLLVLLLLFPLVATIIAFSRHVIGLRGFGIYTPAVLSVVLVSTGIPIGIAIFLVIIISSIVLRKILKKLNLAHLPKSALILWGVCATVIAFLILMAYFRFEMFYSLTIFPLLILVSLSENFTSTQLVSNTKEAIKLTFETLILAMIATLIIGNEGIQKFTIINPEVVLLVPLIANILIGRYTGLRFLEMLRFKDILNKK